MNEISLDTATNPLNISIDGNSGISELKVIKTNDMNVTTEETSEGPNKRSTRSNKSLATQGTQNASGLMKKEESPIKIRLEDENVNIEDRRTLRSGKQY